MNMAHGKLVFVMPAPSNDAFEAFFNTYSIKLRPRWVGALFDWLGGWLFAWETRRRFSAMADYLRQAKCG